MFPSNHLFNTRIDGLPVHPNSANFMASIGSVNIHLDLGQSVNQSNPATYFGIPFNLVNASTPYVTVAYTSTDPGMNWNPRPESDCAVGAGHTVTSPCTPAAAPTPQLPIPASPLVEGGIFPDLASSPYGDHHILMLDTSSCRLWEAYHAYTGTSAAWNIFGSATWDLSSNALRPADWTSCDAAGFPILPLLLRANEASTGTINHAVRFTLGTIRRAYVWPARHFVGSNMNANVAPMGQLFRLKSSYVIPANFSTQSKAILTALKQYGMYLSDIGTNFYIQGDPNPAWSSAVFSEVQSVNSANFEAVDLGPFMARPGWNVNSAAVPP